MISVSSVVLAVLMMTGGEISPGIMIGFYLTLALVMSAAPGVPGGAIMAALPFLGIVGIEFHRSYCFAINYSLFNARLIWNIS